ncbi:MAG TPA: hypothetical protein VIK72_07465 [Clostridiaceae bacterium]
MFAYDLYTPVRLIINEKKDKYRSRIQLDKIMKSLFYIHNKKPVIDLLNSLYGDNIGYSAKLTYLNKEMINESIHKTAVLISHECDMLIKVDFRGKSYEYILEFQTQNDKSIGIRLFRYSFELKVQSINDLNVNPIIIDLPNPYVIMLEENKNVPDLQEIIIRIPNGEQLKYSSRVLKYWQYDLDLLYKNNMYLLFPLKVFQVRKKINKIKESGKKTPKYDLLINGIKDDIFKVTKEILEHINIIYKERTIEVSEYNEFGVVITNLILYLCQEVDKLSHVDEEVRDMIKTLYDPKVELRGTLNAKREDIFNLLEDLGSIPDDAKKLVEKEEDLLVLKKWLKIAAKVNSFDEFVNRATLN